MPTPPKTSLPQLIEIARRLVDVSGPDDLSVSAVAQHAGVRPASLYKHFSDRAALLRAVEISILTDLEAALRAGLNGTTPGERLRSVARAYRAFAAQHPHRYAMLYRRDALADPEIAKACSFAAEPMFEQLRLAGLAEMNLLPLARTLTAFLHGFVSMEGARAFQFGGDLDAAFDAALTTILAGID